MFNTSDRVIVSVFLGLSFTGILSVSYKFSTIIVLLYNIFDKSWCESIILHIKDEDIVEYFNKIFLMIFNLFLSFGLCLLAFMPILFNVLINDNFVDSYNLIPIVIIASIFQVIVGLVSVVYAANNDTKSLANTAIWSSVVNLIIDLALINYIGVYAAAVSTLCSYLFFSIYRAWDVSKKYIHINFNLKYYLIAIITLIIVIICYYSNLIILKLFGMIIAIIYFFVSNKNEIKVVKKTIKSKIKK
ncbi:MAG: polysaccharide biosynthesis C-terminal domain-containing protein [Bacilli bacterium]|nr:polysaccharide biosynthesis C-terminal domain-containing protein [Bacilli bacterium]